MDNEKSSKKGFIIMVIMIFIIAAAAGVYFLYFNSSEDKYLADSLYCKNDSDCVKQYFDCSCPSYEAINKYNYKKLECPPPKPGDFICLGETVGEPKCVKHKCLLVNEE